MVQRGPNWAIALAFLAACDSAPSPGGPCAASKDCVSGEICVGGTCQARLIAPSCEEDEDCELDERCDRTSGECVPITPIVDAGPSSDAGDAGDGGRRDLGIDGGPRDSGRFDAGFVTDTGAFDVPEPIDTGIIPDVGFPDSGAVACTVDANCGDPDLICVSNFCTPACSAPGAPACPGTDACNVQTGRCVPGNIALGLDCTFDLECASDLCLPLTIAMVSRMICSSACGASGQCPIDFSCTDVSGMTFCLGEGLSTPPATFDTPAGGACSTTVNTCQSTWCNTGINACIETCSRDADCAAFGGQCWMYIQPGAPTTYDHLCIGSGGPGLAGAACTLDANCLSGICNRYSATCAAQCCGNADCPIAETCAAYDLDATNIVKICTTRAPTGTGGPGASCATAADCESEVCLAVDPTNPTSPRKCSTLCCRDADCAVLPAGGRCLPIPGPIPSTILGACRPS